MTGSHHPICRRKAAAKADKLATDAAEWQRIFEAEFARLAAQADAAAQDRRRGIQRKPKHWKYHGDTTSYKRPTCELGHLARQNCDRL